MRVARIVSLAVSFAFWTGSGAGCTGGGTTIGTHTTPTDPTDPTDPTNPTTTHPTDPTDPTEPTAGDRRYDCSGMDPADPAPLGGKVILTFDDGPDPVDTPVLLELLRDRGIPATFFMLGQQVSDPANWDLVQEIADDPQFGIGNHSWSHVDLADSSDAVVASEMDDTADLLATFGVDVDHFRFPYGDATCDAHDMATDRGWRVTGWHIDPGDWCYAANGGICHPEDYWRVPEEYSDDMIGLSMEQIRRFDGGVVLFHDIHAWTVDQMGPFIDQVLSEGYTFAALDDAGVLPNLDAGTPADLPYLGERCDTADDRCWQVEHEAWCEPVDPDDPGNTDGVCTLPCEGLCLDRDGAATTFCADVGGAGQCIGRSASQNAYCDDLPGTVEASFDRFVGGSGVGASTATVCAPSWW